MRGLSILIISCGIAISFAEYDAPTSDEVEEVKQYIKDCFQSEEGCEGTVDENFGGIRNTAVRLSNTKTKKITIQKKPLVIFQSSLKTKNFLICYLLAFHDCVGGCDGCINLDNASNNGLSTVILGLDLLYLNNTYAIYDIMSRADYWQLAGIVGIELAVKLSNRNCEDGDARYVLFQTYTSTKLHKMV